MPGQHLLIVDDEDNLRSMLAAALRHHGFQVSTAADGRSALAAIPTERPAAAETESLSFGSAGTVTAVAVEVGDTVTAGDVLATIESASLQVALAEAQATEADAKATLTDDVEALADDEDAITAEQLAADQARYDVAYDQLVDAYIAYVERDLTASIDGVVTAVGVTAGEQLASGGSGGTTLTGSGSGSGGTTAAIGSSSTAMGGAALGGSATGSSAQITIVSVGRYEVALSVDSSDIGAVAVGQTVTLSEATASSSTSGFPGGAGFPGGGGGFPAGGSFPGAPGGQTETDDAGTDTTTETPSRGFDPTRV